MFESYVTNISDQGSSGIEGFRRIIGQGDEIFSPGFLFVLLGQFPVVLPEVSDRKDEKRQPVPVPPAPDTWQEYPEETDPSWQYCRLKK